MYCMILFLRYIFLPRFLLSILIAMWLESCVPIHKDAIETRHLPLTFIFISLLLLSVVQTTKTRHGLRNREKNPIKMEKNTKIGLSVFFISLGLGSILLILEQGTAMKIVPTPLLIGLLAPIPLAGMLMALYPELLWMWKSRQGLSGHLRNWHEEVKNISYKRKIFILVGSILSGSIAMFMYNYVINLWIVFMGFEIICGGLIALIFWWGKNLSPSHPWNPHYWRRLLFWVMVTIPLSYCLMTYVYFPLIQPWLREGIPHSLWKNMPSFYNMIPMYSVLPFLYANRKMTDVTNPPATTTGTG